MFDHPVTVIRDGAGLARPRRLAAVERPAGRVVSSTPTAARCRSSEPGRCRKSRRRTRPRMSGHTSRITFRPAVVATPAASRTSYRWARPIRIRSSARSSSSSTRASPSRRTPTSSETYMSPSSRRRARPTRISLLGSVSSSRRGSPRTCWKASSGRARASRSATRIRSRRTRSSSTESTSGPSASACRQATGYACRLGAPTSRSGTEI